MTWLRQRSRPMPQKPWGQDGVVVIPPRPWYRPAKLPLDAAALGGSVTLGQAAEDSF